MNWNWTEVCRKTNEKKWNKKFVFASPVVWGKMETWKGKYTHKLISPDLFTYNLFVCNRVIVENHFGSRSHTQTGKYQQWQCNFNVRTYGNCNTYIFRKFCHLFYLYHKIGYLLPQLIRQYKICRYVGMSVWVCMCVCVFSVIRIFTGRQVVAVYEQKKMQINMQRATNKNNNKNNESKMCNWLLSKNSIICLCNCDSITN